MDLVAQWGRKNEYKNSASDTKQHTVRVEQCTINAFFSLQESRGLVALYHRLLSLWRTKREALIWIQEDLCKKFC